MFVIKVKPDGRDEFEFETATRDILVWERTGKDRSLSGLMQTLRLADLYEIAYVSAKRQGLWDGNRGEFESTCDIDFEEQKEEELDPTSAAP